MKKKKVEESIFEQKESMNKIGLKGAAAVEKVSRIALLKLYAFGKYR